MDEQRTPQHFATLIRDIDALSRALHIEHCSPELQSKIISEWGNLLFKRLLLRIPAAHTASVQKTIFDMHGEGKDSAELLEALAEYIPDFERTLEEEVVRTLEEFRIAKD